MDEATRSPVSSGPETVHDRKAFAERLMDLKRRGCCVLVTGQVNERTRAAQSRRLFGQSDTARQRVLTLTDATSASAARYLPQGITPTHSTVTTLDYTEQVRITTDTVDPTSQSTSDTTSDDAASMGELGSLLYDPISDTLRTDTVHPGELRLGIATLHILLDTDGLSATRAFVRAIRADILDTHGMGHFHLPGSLDSETIAALWPLVDIHIKLRQSDCGSEHRWHLLETGQTTSWIRL